MFYMIESVKIRIPSKLKSPLTQEVVLEAFQKQKEILTTTDFSALN